MLILDDRLKTSEEVPFDCSWEDFIFEDENIYYLGGIKGI